MEEKLITVTVENFSRAQLIKAKLESEGIECHLLNLNLVQASVSEGVRVMVKESDVKRAIKAYLVIKAQYKRDGSRKVKRSGHIRKILVPVDFSDNAYRTACFAIEIAHIYNASVRFLHVYYSPAIDMISTPDINLSQFNLDLVLDEIKNRAQNDMKLFLSKLSVYVAERSLMKAKITHRIMEGVASDAIFAASETYKPGLIIMGMHGQGNTPNSIIGSIVWKVIQKSRLPVLTIPESSAFNYKSKSYNIMFTTDLDDVDQKTVRKLTVILSPFKNIKIHCVHASDKAINAYQKAKMEELKTYLSGVISAPMHFKFIEGKDYIPLFNDYIKTNKIDLVCMSTRKRNVIERFFSPSLAKKMLYHTNTPLLIINV
ncbi:MAG: Universal stress protein family protein [Bacteroidetes bacterium ADurb.Bin408]|nr:MAG: Universal stress protein family protein [Bacteroidetes bacterium ADurb.Bin408]